LTAWRIKFFQPPLAKRSILWGFGVVEMRWLKESLQSSSSAERKLVSGFWIFRFIVTITNILAAIPTLQSSSIDFPVDGAHIVLVDDVIFTGRTIRAALDALFDYGRPSKVDLAVLIDRGHREIPVEPRFVGEHLNTDRMDRVDVSLEKIDGKDAVEIITQ
jgi:hypothetical protein